jgi:hypothetical protein
MRRPPLRKRLIFLRSRRLATLILGIVFAAAMDRLKAAKG